MILCGLSITEQISGNILPLTIRHFTADAAIIGLILALNPAFGFIAQPLVGIVSDKIWTPLGRRAIFLVGGAPIVALCLVLVPAAQVLWHLVVLVVIFQFFQDVLWGSDHPLIADLVPPHQRTIVKACMSTTVQIVVFLFLKFGIGYALDRFGERFLYWCAAGAQLVLVAGAALFLREKRRAAVTRPKLTPKRYVTDLFGDPVLRRFGFLAMSQAMFFHVVTGFIILFAVHSVGITKAAFGNAWSVHALIALCCAIPLGFAVERIPKQWALVIGYAVALGGCVLGFLARDAGSFFLIAIVFGFGSVIVDVTQKPFFTEYMPTDIIGQLSGAYNICYATGRSLALAGGGLIVSLAGNNYRAIWLIALVFGLMSALIAATIPDRRYSRRRAVRHGVARTGSTADAPAPVDVP